MKTFLLFLAMLIVLCAMSITANAATIDLWLSTDTTTSTFAVHASMAPGEGYGIGVLGFFVTGFDTLENWAPTASALVYTGSNTKARRYTGFSEDLSDLTLGEIAVSLSVSPDYLATGFGQTAGDLSTLFPNWASSWGGSTYTRNGSLEETQSVYDAFLLVAQGTYTPGGAGPMLTGPLTGSYLTSSVLVDGSPVLDGADVVVHNPAPPTTVPEPSSMIVLGSGVVGLLGFLRRRRG